MATLTYVSPDWGRDAEAAKVKAISFYDLRKLGWKGFNKLDWAEFLLEKYPSVPLILLSCNIGKPASFAALEEVADEMSPDDRHMLRDYIIGKLGLEELNCKTGSRCADRRSALHRCAEISLQWP
jgi:hypothetical protein